MVPIKVPFRTIKFSITKTIRISITRLTILSRVIDLADLFQGQILVLLLLRLVFLFPGLYIIYPYSIDILASEEIAGLVGALHGVKYVDFVKIVRIKFIDLVSFMVINIAFSMAIVLYLSINILLQFPFVTLLLSLIKSIHYLFPLVLSFHYFLYHLFRNYFVYLVFANLLYLRKSDLQNSLLVEPVASLLLLFHTFKVRFVIVSTI